MGLLKGTDLMAGSIHDATLFGRKRPFNGAKPNPEGLMSNGRKPFSRMTREELMEHHRAHIKVKTRTGAERKFPGFYYSAKNHSGLIDELFPLGKPSKPRREPRRLKAMSDGQMIDYFRKHYAGKISSWAELDRRDPSFHLNFVEIRRLHTAVDFEGRQVRPQARAVGI